VNTPIYVRQGLKKGHYYFRKTLPGKLVWILMAKRRSVRIVGLNNEMDEWMSIETFKTKYTEHNP
jgi:hypothetical protein